jgi:opacity protein-like surface antigen
MKSILTLVVGLFMAAAMAQADDATMKKELVGYWKSGRHAYWYKEDGIIYMMGGTNKSRWDIRNGKFYGGSVGTPIDYSNGGEKILALTKTTFTTEESDGPSTLKRITKAEAERYGMPDQL